ncbi:hypothetical protein SAMN05444173_1237 [Opitutus sp. GAS368]|nr:hypothetical protein SAMN05444173_1237 [Opitutus sp. GAS368]
MRLACKNQPVILADVNKLCIFAGTTIFGTLGGLLATLFGMEAFSLGSFFLSGVGSVLGVYVGWKVAQHYK